ncbi:unnamed protein product [Auanema sp. JU1783]|nr:unnamed protein product [Auanema sp. JU1783]
MEDIILKLKGISVNSNNIQIITEPSSFYRELTDQSQRAKDRISISTLYLGDGDLEKNLVSKIEENLVSNPKLKVSFLIDFLRGTRGQAAEKSSTSLLKRIADRAEIYLYHSPDLRAFFKRTLPERTNEIIGLQHMKLYIFDDNVLISGANLSDSYFTNRQDRYILFKNSPELADFFVKIIEVVGKSSFTLQSNGDTELSYDCTVHPFQGVYADYIKLLKERIEEVINSFDSKSSNSDTMVYPLLQMGPYGINQEKDFLEALFSLKEKNLNLIMASGYFNTTKEYEELIFEKGTYDLDIITAAPEANGFFGANGLSKYIPSMYSHISKTFLDQAVTFNRNIKLFEYKRQDWTFHAKGIWMETPKFTATLIGSSNYGYRSVHRDLEAQLLLVTTCPKLRSRLREEHTLISNFSSVLDVTALRRAEHHVPALVKVISKLIRNFF